MGALLAAAVLLEGGGTGGADRLATRHFSRVQKALGILEGCRRYSREKDWVRSKTSGPLLQPHRLP
jgi:hypothetical protein